MSDSPQTPEWWLGSDGKWYPPRTAAPPPPPSGAVPPPLPPGAAPPPPAPQGAAAPPGWWLASDGQWYPPGPPSSPRGLPTRASVSGGLTGTLQGFLWASGGLSLLGAILALVGLGKFEEWQEAPDGSISSSSAFEDMTSADEAINGMVSFAGLAGIVVFVLLVIWTYQAHQATQQLWPGPRTWSSGWSVGGWFIPVANAIIPKLVLTEIERIALAPRPGGGLPPDWRGRSTLAIGWLWWLLFVAGLTVGTIGFGLFDDPEGSVSSWRTGYWMTAAGYGTLAVASAFGALYIRRVGRALSPAGIIGTR